MTDWFTNLRRVDQADVYKHDHLAAKLRRGVNGVEFCYLPEYLDNGGPPVASTLPLSAEPQLAPAGAVPAFFAGLLPEGRRLSALRRAVKTSADDELSLLLAVGADVVGDVRVLPVGVAPHEVTPAVETTDFTKINFSELFAKSVGADPDRVGIPGIQDKVSARMITFPLANQGSQFILKLNPPEFRALVENEAFFLQAARNCGIQTVDTQLVRDAAGACGLLVRRFDRVHTQTGPVVSLAVEDGCQALGRYPADKYVVTSEEICLALCAMTSAPRVTARELLMQLAFAYLTCNGDMHAKNLAVLQEVHGDWRLAPAFDLPSSYPYGDTSMALSLGGRSREDITRTVFIEFGKTIGVSERATIGVLNHLCEHTHSWLVELDTLPFDAKQLHKLQRAINYRRRQLR